MHYAEYKHTDPVLVHALVDVFPFAAISVNGTQGPRIAHAPFTFRNGKFPAGALEFHLAKANPIARDMKIANPSLFWFKVLVPRFRRVGLRPAFHNQTPIEAGLHRRITTSV